MMHPSIWIYGGVHYDPGTRQRFLEEFAKQGTPPHFVAVEWEKSVFEKFVQWRPWVEERLRSRRDFLTSQDCRELSLALAWEGDAYTAIFPEADLLWLETSFQEVHFKQRYGVDANKFPESFAIVLVERLCNPCQPTMNESIANAYPPPEPRSKRELIDRVWKKVWSEANGAPGGFDRDARWATTICERSSGLHDGWIAVVVGWEHADPTSGDQRLRGLLLSKGFSVNSVRLGP
jgi:hypothetical protein